METLIIRYALPGFPIAITMFLWEKTTPPTNSPTFDVAICTALAIILGYVVQQCWMLLFDTCVFGLGYNSKQRPVLKEMASMLEDGDLPNYDKLYVRWESFVYSKEVDDPLRQKAKDFWTYFHSSAANALGMLVAAALSLAMLQSSTADPPGWLGYSSAVCLLMCLLLTLKTIQTKKLVDSFELRILEMNYDCSAGPNDEQSSGAVAH